MSDTKLRSLDALRGLAILLVISAHFGGGSVFQQAMLGNAGVILFFFLSGFLMDRTLSRDANPASYAVHRAFRIMPMYLLSIALVIVLGPHWTLGEVVSNATFTAPAFGAQRMLGVYWTLYIEVLFYLIAPFLMIAGIRAVQYLTYAALALFAVFALTSGVGSGAPFT